MGVGDDMLPQLSPADQRKIDRASNRVLAKWNAARKRLDAIIKKELKK